ncbi:MAG: glycosyltransferase family 10 [Desulfobulbaceae bacterium]|nr:glycosyltransferase family 10 [Desulfobulbaceae bacterium]HIJ91445.1 hypothetical protein [Deltaproteobacteria bacterium]
MTLVRIVKDWDWPNLLRQTPGEKGIWDDITFTLTPAAECDYLVMLNNRMEIQTSGQCPKKNIWMLIQEPYQKGFTDWVIEKHEPFAKVFTHHPPANGEKKYIISPPAIPWHVNKTYDELISCPLPKKTKSLSWIVGAAKDLPGHLQRLIFLETVKKSSLSIDLFGRAVCPIEDKWDGLAPYFFSLAIENNNGPDMWTEKLADCFLSWSVPFYFGCTNLEKYFPKDSYIPIDIHNPSEAMRIIKENSTPENWEKRIPAIQQARDLVLNKYQLFPFLAEQIHTHPTHDTVKLPFTINPYKRSLRARGHRLAYKISKLLR